MLGLVELQPRTSKHFFYTIMEEIEIWKQIEDSRYWVSNWGNVKSEACVVEYINGRKNKHSGGEIKKQIGNKGYYKVRLRGSIQRFMVIHRLVANYFIPNPDNKPQVNHIDGNKLNNHVSNLEWTTSKENVNHAIKNKLRRTGDDNPIALVNHEIADQIRSVFDSKKYNQTEIGEMFGISRTLAGYIIRKQLWYK